METTEEELDIAPYVGAEISYVRGRLEDMDISISRFERIVGCSENALSFWLNGRGGSKRRRGKSGAPPLSDQVHAALQTPVEIVAVLRAADLITETRERMNHAYTWLEASEVPALVSSALTATRAGSKEAPRQDGPLGELVALAFKQVAQGRSESIPG